MEAQTYSVAVAEVPKEVKGHFEEPQVHVLGSNGNYTKGQPVRGVSLYMYMCPLYIIEFDQDGMEHIYFDKTHVCTL